ncbi:flavodoxin domain-containing protein [Streptomyces fradiae]|uniref:flavodoxin domain-containing protein n=1 Tax=Streptomyces fradiae TaxID=1906 RepID=UPI00294274FC|nr:flavodoxin domain-containing protein [Streptomyces fradiae]WOI61318.1 flavodoxin domain-containing protein [Streptomyces fradiae]
MSLVRVLYASEHGSTEDIARRIAARLAAHGHRTEVGDIKVSPRLEPGSAAAVVLGSAVYGGAWLPPAEAFVRREVAALGAQPVWMFSVGLTAALPKPLRSLAARSEQPRISRLVELLRPRAHHRFSGVIRPGHLDRKGRVIFRLLFCRYGDFRNWAEIDAWADRIAREVGVPGGVRGPGAP